MQPPNLNSPPKKHKSQPSCRVDPYKHKPTTMAHSIYMGSNEPPNLKITFILPHPKKKVTINKTQKNQPNPTKTLQKNFIFFMGTLYESMAALSLDQQSKCESTAMQ